MKKQKVTDEMYRTAHWKPINVIHVFLVLLVALCILGIGLFTILELIKLIFKSIFSG